MPPLQLQAINNPFATDHRPEAVMAIGVALFVAGIYHVTQPQPTLSHSAGAALESAMLMGAGGIAVICAKEIVNTIDKAGER